MLKKPKQNSGMAPPMLRKLVSTANCSSKATYVTVGLKVAPPSMKAQRHTTVMATYLRVVDQLSGSLGSEVGVGTKTMLPLVWRLSILWATSTRMVSPGMMTTAVSLLTVVLSNCFLGEAIFEPVKRTFFRFNLMLKRWWQETRY